MFSMTIRMGAAYNTVSVDGAVFDRSTMPREVLPSIRKSGGYRLEPGETMPLPASIAQATASQEWRRSRTATRGPRAVPREGTAGSSGLPSA